MSVLVVDIIRRAGTGVRHGEKVKVHNSWRADELGGYGLAVKEAIPGGYLQVQMGVNLLALL